MFVTRYCNNFSQGGDGLMTEKFEDVGTLHPISAHGKYCVVMVFTGNAFGKKQKEQAASLDLQGLFSTYLGPCFSLV